MGQEHGRSCSQTLLETIAVQSRRTNRHAAGRPQLPACQYVVHPGSVAILPLVDDGHLCLIRSRRLTVGQTLIEVPAGTREPGETPLETARRELEEETGYRAAQLGGTGPVLRLARHPQRADARLRGQRTDARRTAAGSQ